MPDACYVVLDSQGRQLAGPLTEREARAWVTLNYYRQPRPYAIGCIGPAWDPLVTYASPGAVPRGAWDLQRDGHVIAVKTPDGKVAVFF